MAMAHVSSSEHKGFSYMRNSPVPLSAPDFKYLMENSSSECPVSWQMAGASVEHFLPTQQQQLIGLNPTTTSSATFAPELEWHQFVSDPGFVGCSASLTIPPVSNAVAASASSSPEVSNKNTNMSSYNAAAAPPSITSSPNPGGWTTSSGLSLTVDPSKGGLALQGLTSFPADFPTDPGFAERAARFSSSPSPFYGHQSPNKLSRTSSMRGDNNLAVEEALTSGVLDESKLFSKLHKVVASQQQQEAGGAGVISPSLGSGLREDSQNSIDHQQLQGGINTATTSNTTTPTRKRKSSEDKCPGRKVSEAEDNKTKRAKGVSELPKDLKDTEGKAKAEKSTGSENSGSSSPKSTAVKDSPKPPEPPKQDYIHVRARRGQATDSHSLAERVRREKISERMKFLQDLVPGCSKVTGKAVMLDEIINYVQSLQRQVEFLSMKLAAVNPRLDVNLDGILTKEVLQGRASTSPVVLSHDLGSNYSSHIQQLQHAQMQLGSCGLDLRALENVIRGDAFGDSTSQASSVWDGDLQSVVQMSFGALSQELQGHLPAGHMKVEI